LEINQKTNSNTDIANALIVIAHIYREQKSYDKAIEYAKKGMMLLDDIDALLLKQEACQILAESYELTGNYKDAVVCFREYQEIKDTVFSQKNRDAINDLNRRYRAEQYEQELGSQQALLDKEKTKRSFYLGIILFLIALGFLSFYTIQQKQFANQKLQELNEEVKAQNEEMLLTQNRLKVANQDLNSFTTMASHDLKEPLRMMSSFSQLLKRRNKNLDESSQEYINYITDAAQRMSRMLDDMLNYSTNRIRIENMEYLDTNKLLATVQENLKLRIEENNVVIHIANNLPQIKGQASLIEQTFQNLIANGIKFQQLNVRPEISITAESTAKENIFKITDNGIGIAPENQANVFQLFKRFNEEYEGSGIGLTTCKKIMELHNGTIDLQSEIGEGTTFILRFPV
jgi:signal transduction histidine kinase